MSYLRKYRRPDRIKGKYTVSMSFRVSQEMYNQWQAYCDKELNLDSSEALRLMIEEELKAVKRESSPSSAAGSPRLVSVSSPVPTEKKNLPRSRFGGRFTVNPWEVQGRVPCPICENWHHRSNYSRHARTAHDMSSQELIEGNKEKADAMAEEARASIQE